MKKVNIYLNQNYIPLRGNKTPFKNIFKIKFSKCLYLFLILLLILLLLSFTFSKNIIALLKIKNIPNPYKNKNNIITQPNINIFTKESKIKKNETYFSICIPVYNMEKYIERSISSIKKQTFKDYEIVIVNDCSNDNSETIIKNLQKEDNRIKLINHQTNMGIYASRVDSITNSKGKYIIFLDSDDSFFNNELLQQLFDYNIKYNLDIIEYMVYYENEGKNDYL